MAKLSAHGEEFGRVDRGNVVYRVMADGIILRQFRFAGRLDRPTVASRLYRGRPEEALAELRLRFGAGR